MTASTIEIKCLNSKIAWEEAFRRYDNSEVKNMKDFSSSRVRSLASEVESNFCVNIPNNNTTNDIDAVLENFPVIFFSNKTRSMLVDLHELLFEKDCLLSLLAANEESVRNEVAKPKIVKSTATVYGPKNKVGCKPLWQKFLQLIEIGTKFIKGHSFQAHVWCCETTGTGNGIILRDIRKHLLENVPGLSNHGISLDAIHHLTVAPRKNSSRFHRYKGLIDAKVAAKRNQYREPGKNQHFLFARVAYREEFVVKHYKEANFYSCDDMNKLRMEPGTVVWRYHQQFQFFMSNDSPNLNDHEFPNPGYLLVPSGYILMKKVTGMMKRMAAMMKKMKKPLKSLFQEG